MKLGDDDTSPDRQIEAVNETSENGLGPHQSSHGLSEHDFDQVEKRLKRKLDIRLMAMIVLIYTMNFLDRNNIASAKIIGLETSLHMNSTQFSTAVSLLFVGYVLMQVPSNIFLAQLRPSVYLPACMMVWGTLSTCTGAVQSAGGLYAIRFLLGFVEAAFYPGCVFLIGSWYKRSETGIRCAFLYSGALVGSAFSGLISAGINSGLNGALGLESWRWVFIIEGAITVTIALMSFLILPNYPHNTRWLSPEEQVVADWRLRHDAGDIPDENEPWAVGFKSAFQDWRTYVFALLFHCVLVTSSTQNFFPSVVQTLGFGETETLLLTVPPYVIAIITSVTNNWSADRLRNSSFHIMWPFAIVVIGCVLGAATLDKGARYFAMILMIAGGHSANAVTISWAQKTLLRPRIKRAAAVAFINAVGNCAQIWTSYMYPNNDKPRYVLAMSVNAGFALLGIAITIFMRVILLQANRRLEAGANAAIGMDFAKKDRVESDEPGATEHVSSFRYVT